MKFLWEASRGRWETLSIETEFRDPLEGQGVDTVSDAIVTIELRYFPGEDGKARAHWKYSSNLGGRKYHTRYFYDATLSPKARRRAIVNLIEKWIDEKIEKQQAKLETLESYRRALVAYDRYGEDTL